MKFAVGETLRLGSAEVGYARVETFAKLRAGAAIQPMARGAVRDEQLSSLLQIVSCGIEYVLGAPLRCWNRKVSNLAGQVGFRSSRSGSRAKAAMNPQRRSETKNGKNQEQCQSKSRPGAHTLLL